MRRFERASCAPPSSTARSRSTSSSPRHQPWTAVRQHPSLYLVCLCVGPPPSACLSVRSFSLLLCLYDPKVLFHIPTHSLTHSRAQPCTSVDTTGTLASCQATCGESFKMGCGAYYCCNSDAWQCTGAKACGGLECVASQAITIHLFFLSLCSIPFVVAHSHIVS